MVKLTTGIFDLQGRVATEIFKDGEVPLRNLFLIVLIKSLYYVLKVCVCVDMFLYSIPMTFYHFNFT